MCLRPSTPADGQSRAAEAKQLREKIENGSTPADREAGLIGIKEFAEAVGPASEPFTVPLLGLVLKALGEKVC